RHQGTGPMTRRALIGMLIACGGCFSWGTPPDKFPPALGPEGARVALRVRGESADRLGELLAVDSTGITIRGDRVITVAWPKVAALDVKDVGLDYDIVMGEPVSPEKIARLALLSRFPQGMRRVPVAIDSLIAATSGGIERFKDRRVASAEGYRRVGADFPGMGEHWLNVGMLLKNEIDPTRPTLLAYATIHGQPTLLGAGYIVVTRDGEPPPDVPGWPAEWHEHSGLLSDESSGLHDAHHSHSETHMWVMHV